MEDKHIIIPDFNTLFNIQVGVSVKNTQKLMH